MNNELNNNEVVAKDNELIRVLQEDCPISQRPYLEVANKLGWTENDVISRLNKLIESGVIRKFGAKLAPRKMGYVSTLAAASIPDNGVESAAEIINAYNGVTHNYLREGEPNLWFTLTEPNSDTLNKHLDEIEKKIGKKIIRMPATKVYKIGVKFDI